MQQTKVSLAYPALLHATIRRCFQGILLLCGMLLSCDMAFAHQSSTAYLALQQHEQGQVHAEYRLAVRDLALITPLDGNADLRISWGEVQAQQNALYALLASNMQFLAQQKRCQLQQQQPMALDQIAGMTYVVAAFSVHCATMQPEQLDYHLLQNIDSGHRLIISMQQAGESARSWMMAPGQTLLQQQSLRHTFVSYVQEGIHHILTGYDHLLFLLCLLLPAVYQREQGQWVPVRHASTTIKRTLYIATAFTAAHSITLSLAALNIVSIPARLIESVIAFSIALAALNNLIPFLGKRQVMIAFLFGLVHGFGFANALSSLPLERLARVTALFSFNVGIELGQLLCIVIFLPIALLIRQRSFYQRWVLQSGSVLACVLALLWMVQRLFNLNLIPG